MWGRGKVGPYDGHGFTFCDGERVEGLCRGKTRASASLTLWSEKTTKGRRREALAEGMLARREVVRSALRRSGRGTHDPPGSFYRNERARGDGMGEQQDR